MYGSIGFVGLGIHALITHDFSKLSRSWCEKTTSPATKSARQVAKDITKALYWFAEAAQHGDKRTKKRLDVLTHKHLEDVELLNESEAEEFNALFSSDETLPF